MAKELVESVPRNLSRSNNMRETPRAQRFLRGHDIYANPEGAKVPLNALTDFRSLTQLLTAYNHYVHRVDRDEFNIDPAVVPIRDALAHGRVSAPGATDTFQLIKYDRPTKENPSHVRVAYRVTVTKEWIDSQVRHVQSQMLRVCDAHEALPEIDAP